MSDIREDISFMRNLAEKGRRGPILGGTFLFAAGVVFGGTCFVQWAVWDGLIGLTFTGPHVLYLWLGASAAFAVIWFALFFRLKSRTGAKQSASNAVFGIAWSACAIGVLTAFAAIWIIAAAVGSNIVLNGYVPMIFSFYGVAWFTSAALANRRWMYAAATGSFAFCLIMAALADRPVQLLVMGLALLLLLSLPGLQLMREEARP
jgi:hypothetical protein